MGKRIITPAPNSGILTSRAPSFLICEVSVAQNLVWLHEATKTKPTKNVIHSAMYTLNIAL